MPLEERSGARGPFPWVRLARVLLLLAFVAVMIAIVLWREADAAAVDPPSMIMRLLALGAGARALLEGALFLGRVRRWVRAPKHRLHVDEDTLTWQSPKGTVELAASDLLTATQVEDALFLVTRTELVRLPAIFGDVTEAIQSWARASIPPTAPSERPSELYDSAARGRAEGVVVLRHGWAWLRRGPYASLLIGMVFLDASLRLPEGVSLGLLPYLGLGACAAVPLGWLALAFRDIAPRRGLALVITPAEALMRTRGGILRAPWTRLEDITIQNSLGWSVLGGRHARRRLVLLRKNDTPIRYDEAYLGAPAEAVVALIDAFSSQGSGGGGGISD